MTSRTSRPSETRRLRPPDRGGFTLLELLLALGVVSLALALALPRVGAVRAAYLAAEEAREVAGFVRAARLDAIANRTLVGLAMASDRDDVLEHRRVQVRSWWTAEDSRPAMTPRDDQDIWSGSLVRVASFSGTLRMECAGQGILFFANGSSTGGQISLNDADGRPRHRFRIDPATGEVFAQRSEEP